MDEEATALGRAFWKYADRVGIEATKKLVDDVIRDLEGFRLDTASDLAGSPLTAHKRN
jgi:hypothetical protein